PTPGVRRRGPVDGEVERPTGVERVERWDASVEEERLDVRSRVGVQLARVPDLERRRLRPGQRPVPPRDIGLAVDDVADHLVWGAGDADVDTVGVAGRLRGSRT